MSKGDGVPHNPGCETFVFKILTLIAMTVAIVVVII
jgi:hypothetical protein